MARISKVHVENTPTIIDTPNVDYSHIKQILEDEIESLSKNSKEIECIMFKLSKQPLTDKDKKAITNSFKETEKLSKKFKKGLNNGK